MQDIKEDEVQEGIIDERTPEPTPESESEPELETETVVEEEEPVVEESAPEGEQTHSPQQEEELKMFDQKYVNDLVGRTRMEARDKDRRARYDKYGVESEEELDNYFSRGQAYDVMEGKYNEANQLLKDVMAENALLKSGIIQNRWEDAKLILSGKGLEINPENLQLEIQTHPEWLRNQEVPSQGNYIEPREAEIQSKQPMNNIAQMKQFGMDVPEQEELDEETKKQQFMDKYFRG